MLLVGKKRHWDYKNWDKPVWDNRLGNFGSGNNGFGIIDWEEWSTIRLK